MQLVAPGYCQVVSVWALLDQHPFWHRILSREAWPVPGKAFELSARRLLRFKLAVGRCLRLAYFSLIVGWTAAAFETNTGV